jgi:aspartyl-tRNA(Asn)/glutamyl-tRNA(Gln) amidotransferase subunit B
MRSAEEAVEYARTLHKLVVEEIDICDGSMQEGSFRFDANVSVRRPCGPLGTRSEIKNLNSFRFLQHAIEFEVRRQIELLEEGGKVVQETRLYDADRDETRSMRTKEEAHDYRYFPDPDLPPLEISEDWIAQIRGGMKESLESQRNRFIAFGLSSDQVSQLAATRNTSAFALAAFAGAAKDQVPTLANWILGPLAAKLNEEKLDISESKVTPDMLAALLTRVSDGTVSNSTAVSKVLPALWAGEGTVDEVIARKGLKQISDAGEIERVVDEVLAANARQVEDYRAGKEKAFNSLVGQVMKATRGKGNPAQINELLRRKLGR